MKNYIKFKKRYCLFFVLIIFILLFFLTGIFQNSSINNHDLERWDYNEEGIIIGAEEFILEGENNICWYLIHGYTSTPDEMREVAESIHKEFGDTVFVTRLKGHGEVPGNILGLTLDDWFVQTSEEFDILSKKCNKINLVGFSFGGTLITRLAETKKVNNSYLLSPYLFSTYNFYQVFKTETYLNIFGNIFNYSKKTKIGQINSPTGLEKHIAYWNMPFTPVKDSAPFIKNVINNLSKISTPILLQQSKNDKTSDIKSSVYVYNNISSKDKELIIFEKSNHIIVEDYDKNTVIKNIIDFEKKIRNL